MYKLATTLAVTLAVPIILAIGMTTIPIGQSANAQQNCGPPQSRSDGSTVQYCGDQILQTLANGQQWIITPSTHQMCHVGTDFCMRAY
jgi:hypothetical protein